MARLVAALLQTSAPSICQELCQLSTMDLLLVQLDDQASARLSVSLSRSLSCSLSLSLSVSLSLSFSIS